MRKPVPTVEQELIAAFKQLTFALARNEKERAVMQTKLAQTNEECRALREQLASKPRRTKRKSNE